MTCFEAGFVKYARECGLTDQKSAHLFKRAMEHPGAVDMFKDMSEEPQHSPENLETLASLLKQHLMHNEMEHAAKKIQL